MSNITNGPLVDTNVTTGHTAGTMVAHETITSIINATKIMIMIEVATINTIEESKRKTINNEVPAEVLAVAAKPHVVALDRYQEARVVLGAEGDMKILLSGKGHHRGHVQDRQRVLFQVPRPNRRVT
jgi:hypothetical protein